MDNKPVPVDIVIYVRVEGAPTSKAGAISEIIYQLHRMQDDGIVATYDWEAVSI